MVEDPIVFDKQKALIKRSYFAISSLTRDFNS